MSARLCLLLATTSALTHFATAALPPLTPSELSEKATLVVTGKVAGSRVMSVRKPGSTAMLVRLLAEVETVEKGVTLPADSRHLDIRCRRIVATSVDGPMGHTNIPAEGARFRMWLLQNEESQWEPLEPNGIELLDGSAAMDFSGMAPPQSMRDFTVGGVIGIATLIALAIFLWRRRTIR